MPQREALARLFHLVPALKAGRAFRGNIRAKRRHRLFDRQWARTKDPSPVQINTEVLNYVALTCQASTVLIKLSGAPIFLWKRNRTADSFF